MAPETVLAVAVSYVGNPLSMYLAIKRKPAGWWIVAFTQAAFVAFAVVSVDWRFGGQVLCLGMGCYGVYRWSWRREHEPELPTPRHRGGPASGPRLMDLPELRSAVQDWLMVRYGMPPTLAIDLLPSKRLELPTDPQLLLGLLELGNEHGRRAVADAALQVLAHPMQARQRVEDSFPPARKLTSTTGAVRAGDVRLVLDAGTLGTLADDAILALHLFDQEGAASLRTRLERIKLESQS